MVSLIQKDHEKYWKSAGAILLLYSEKRVFIVIFFRLKNCLQEGDDIPTDFTQLFDMQLFKMDNSVLPKVLQ